MDFYGHLVAEITLDIQKAWDNNSADLLGTGLFVDNYCANDALRCENITHTLLEAKNWDPEKGIILVDVADTEPQRIIAAEHLNRIEKIIEALRRDVIVGKSHEWDFPLIHHFCDMGMG